MMKRVMKSLLAVMMFASCLSLNVFEAKAANTNLALNKTAVASSQEVDSLGASKAVDGDKTSKASRWSTKEGSGPEWIYVDLGSKQSIQTIRIYWENRKTTSYSVSVATTDSAPSADSSDWVVVKDVDARPASTSDFIELDNAVEARFVRLYIDGFTREDPDGGVEWPTTSIYELEVYAGIYEEPVETETKEGCLNAIKVTQPAFGDTELKVELPESETYDVFYNGTDYEQVIGADMEIYQPLTTQTVKANFKVVNKNDPNDYGFKEVSVVVPGRYIAQEGDNPALEVLPQLREWKGFTGDFTLNENSKVIYKDTCLENAANEFVKDYYDLTGVQLSAVLGERSSAKAGDIYFETVTSEYGLDDEGYMLEILDVVLVQAESATGAYWATRTLLQVLKQTNTTIPKGITRDYPLYQVRGFVLDVGRKAFSLDFLKQMVKEMAWYKMNDFQVHLADNYIWLEDYNTVEEKFTAYSGYRLESDITQGGADGLYKADLTSKDTAYSKEEFKQFIKDSRALGVDIVPEIDTPAHSLAMTKVRPDLRLGDGHRDPDHLNLTNGYENSIDFIKQVFEEYMTGADPVFDDQTIVHIGADEYFANSVAFRKYANEMMDYIKASGRTPRIWGSWSNARNGEDLRAEGAQINIWNYGYANYDEMYEEGFGLIDVNDGQFYIVPNAGYYFDYLNNSVCYNDALNGAGGVSVPAGDPQVLGAEFAVWNDMVGLRENGVSEYDVYDRVAHSLGIFACNAWGKGDKSLSQAESLYATLGDAPNTNFNYDVDYEGNAIVNLSMDSTKDLSENGFDLADDSLLKEVDGKQALYLAGNESYVDIKGLETVGLDKSLRFKVKRTTDSDLEQILFESAYGNIKAVDGETGKVAIERENRTFVFNYELPVNVWVELEIKNEFEVVKLHVNGELVDVIGDGESVKGRPLIATCMLPLDVIGSKTNSFIGFVDDIKVCENDFYTSTTALDYYLQVAAALNVEDKVIDDAKAVVNKVDATIKEIVYAKNAIAAAIPTDYEKADYTALTTYYEFIEGADSDYFEDEGVESVANIFRNDYFMQLIAPKQLQATIDGLVVAIENTFDALKVKEKADANYVDPNSAKYSASSYQKDGSNPENVADGNASTMWHTDWNITSMPHWLQVELEEVQSVDGIVFTPRSGAGNGTPTNITIALSSDGSTWTNVVENKAVTFVDGENTVEFNATEAKYVKLYFNAAKNNNGSCAELKVRLANVEVDTAPLTLLIASSEEALELYAFSDESKAIVQAAINDAKTKLNSTNPDEVIQAELALAQAYVKLRVENATTTKVDVTTKALDAVVALVEGLDKAKYSEESMAALESAMAKVKDVENMSQAEIDALTKEITSAYEALVVAPFIYKNALERAIIDAEILETSKKYNAATTKALTEAKIEAQAVFANEDATQAEIEAARKAIYAAKKALVYSDGESVDASLLAKAIDDAKKVDTSKYTSDSVAELASKLSAAEAVYAKDDATQQEIDDAIVLLNDAIAALKEKPVEPPVPPMNFVDVKEGAWFYGSVESAYQKGLMSNTGKGKEYFEPDTPISRGMVATVLYRMAGLPKVEFKATFSDVTNSKLWYATAITWASQNNVVSGYKDGRFGPDDNITRQDLAIMLRNFAKANGLNTNAKVDFSAFKDGNKVVSYAQSAVQFCIDAKLMSGAKKADGVYLNPTDNATRAECAKMFSLLDDAIKAK